MDWKVNGYMYCKYTSQISSNGSHFLTARVFAYWPIKVSKLGYGQTKWMIPMNFKYTAHIGSNGSHLFIAWFLVYWTYKVSKFVYGRTKSMVTMYFKQIADISSKLGHFLTARVSFHDAPGYYRVSVKVTMYTAHISSNRSHFLPAGFLEYWPLSKIEYGLFSYALQPAKHTSASFMVAILEEYLVRGKSGVHNIFVNPLRLKPFHVVIIFCLIWKPSSLVIIWNPDLAVNDVP